MSGGGPVRTVLVGCGWAGRSIWLPRLADHPAYQVVAAVDPDPAARGAVAGRGAPNTLADLDEIDRDEVDLAVVAVPNHLHAPIASRLLERGIPVFVEKPVCLTVAEADRLSASERAGGAVLLAGSAAPYRADVRALYALAAELGPIRHVDVAWIRARGVPGSGGWFTDRSRSGGGALVDLGWHLLDAVGPMLGTASFDQVVGAVSADFVNDGYLRAGWRGDAETASSGTGDVEDTARGFLVTEDGVSVALRASWASHQARDLTRFSVESVSGTAELTCTFGFSSNRQAESVLTRTRHGTTVPVRLPVEPVGVEYSRQLDELPALLADPARRGRAIGGARQTIGVIERLYGASPGLGRAPRVPEVQGVG